MRGATVAWASSTQREPGVVAGNPLTQAVSAASGEGPALEEGWRVPVPRDETLRPAELLPWVSASQWGSPVVEAGSEAYERNAVTSWAAFEAALESRFACPPAFVHVDELPLFHVRTPRETVFATKLRKLIRAKTLREVRHRAKREWKSVFLDHPGMTYEAYEARLYQINNIGRDPGEYDAANVESMARELKQDFLGQSRQDGEVDIPLLSWGPLAVMDTGSLKFDLGALTSSDGDAEEAELGGGSKRPLIETKDYVLHTNFQFDVDPTRALSGAGTASMLRRYGVDVELDLLSDVLRKNLVSFEVELQGNGEGELKGFFNLVLKSR